MIICLRISIQLFTYSYKNIFYYLFYHSSKCIRFLIYTDYNIVRRCTQEISGRDMYYANNMMDDDRRFQEKIFGKKK